ncbi:MAG: lipid A deacylase LpxR family protein [Bacteroidetes bacterium]|nr:MAG: lipid A deacylase LpxR family protein [Bacteroidota bacterium]
MIRQILIIIVVFSLIPDLTCAENLDSLSFNQHKELILKWDNDMFVYKDYYYTQGANIAVVHPALRKNPANIALLKLKNADNYFGLELTQEIYTPKNVTDSLLNTVDRPYSGTLFISSFVVSSVPAKKLKLTSQLDLGVLGPLSGAKQAQQYIHEWLNLGFPGGWDFQIKNRPYINYNLSIHKTLISVPEFFDLIGKSDLRIGNIHNDFRLGGEIRIGRMNDFYKGINLSNRKYDDNRDFQFFMFAGSGATFVLYNATLMGGIIPPENNHYFDFNQIEKLVGEFYFGVQVSWKYLGFSAQTTWKTPEFELGEQHGWGNISLYFRF